MPVRFVIFDLDDTLVHSAAVRCAFRHVAARDGIPGERVEAACDRLPGRSAFEIFEALGLARDEAADAAVAFLARLEQLEGLLGATSLDLSADERARLEAHSAPPPAYPQRFLAEQNGIGEVPSLRRERAAR